MKIQIRQNVFETNSSSMHSLVICNTDELAKEWAKDNVEYDSHYSHEQMLEELSPDENGVVDYSYRYWDFGRAPFRVLQSFEDKVQYLLASYYCYNRSEFDNAIKLIQKLVPEVKEIKIPKKDPDYNYRHIDFDESYYFDWQDEYNFTDEEFLTSDEFVVIQDGDEYGKWVDCLEAGIVDFNIVKLDTHTEYEKRFWEMYRAEQDTQEQEG